MYEQHAMLVIMNKTILRELGLGEKEIAIYLALLKHGRTTPAHLGRITKINRATAYHLCKSLVSRGLAAEDLGSKSLALVPVSANNLSFLLKKEREQFSIKENLVKKLMSEVSLISAEHEYPVPKIQFIEEHRLRDFLFANAERWNDSALEQDRTWWGFQDHTLVEEYYDWIEFLWKTAHKTSLVKLFSNSSTIEAKLQGKYKHREIKYLKDNHDFTASIWIVGDYLIMMATRQKPHYLVEIHDQTLANNLRKTFKELWQRT